MKIIKKEAKKIIEKIFTKTQQDLDEINSQVKTILAEIDKVNSVLSKNTDTLIISENLALTRLYNGSKIYVDPMDVAVAPSIMFDGIWEKSTTNAWESVFEEGQTVIDVGANFGYFGLLASLPQYSNHQRIIMFEANPELIPYISKTLSVNGLHKITKIENLAISNKIGTANLTLLNDFVGNSTLHNIEHLDGYLNGKMPLEVKKQFSVKTISIDEYCKSKKIDSVDLIKIDIEGYEEQAYAGMKNIVKKSKNLKLFIEFTRDSYDNPKDFYNQLVSDFKYLYLINENGGLYEPAQSDYESVIGGVEIFTMLVFAQKPIKGVA